MDWFKTHQKGKDLWVKLASCALNGIDEESKGNSKLFEFLDAATDFEELLYGLEPFLPILHIFLVNLILLFFPRFILLIKVIYFH